MGIQISGSKVPDVIATIPLLGILQTQLSCFPRQEGIYLQIGNPYEHMTSMEWMVELTALHGAATVESIPAVADNTHEIGTVYKDKAFEEIEQLIEQYESLQRDLTSCGVPITNVKWRPQEKDVSSSGIDERGYAVRLSRGSSFKIIPTTQFCLIGIRILKGKPNLDKRLKKNKVSPEVSMECEKLSAESQLSLSGKLLEQLQTNGNVTYEETGLYRNHPHVFSSETVDEQQDSNETRTQEGTPKNKSSTLAPMEFSALTPENQNTVENDNASEHVGNDSDVFSCSEEHILSRSPCFGGANEKDANVFQSDRDQPRSKVMRCSPTQYAISSDESIRSAKSTFSEVL